MISDRKARIGIVACVSLAWLAMGVFVEQAHAAAVGAPVNQEAIVVSLPVFFVCMGGAITFTWFVAQWDAKRTRKLERLEQLLIRRGIIKPSEDDE